ncbi:putative membrane protein [Orenia metallireducens]|jgi:putative membrane protein|uniref:Putative membrane protein n=1 Tax=Orenia metallireducens TaxID=1413210 RepID=A0A285HCH5_9FIRM|nr:SHOCT domain-containing protein [Orenia metallireducens]PRX27691.1 putative membrane protein [Orenia metallireducens]SNY33435.1 putative membrane protein [Orenia metallireducens]
MWSDLCSGIYSYGLNGWQSIGIMLLHLGVFIGIIYLIIRLLILKSKREDSAMALLKKQLAQGLITKEEFRERKEVLKK